MKKNYYSYMFILILISIIYFLIYQDSPCNVMGCGYFTYFIYIPLLYIIIGIVAGTETGKKNPPKITILKRILLIFLVFSGINAIIYDIFHGSSHKVESIIGSMSSFMIFGILFYLISFTITFFVVRTLSK